MNSGASQEQTMKTIPKKIQNVNRKEKDLKISIVVSQKICQFWNLEMYQFQWRYWQSCESHSCGNGDFF